MKIEQLKRIFDFLEEKGEHRAPVKWKLINNIPLTKEELNVKGDLDLRFSSITSLPEGLKVGGDLNLRKANITSLPEGLKVGGDLMLYKSAIESLPKDLIVGGSLELSYSKITSLPKGLEVHRSLFIKNIALLEYTDGELKKMVKPGFIKGKIYR